MINVLIVEDSVVARELLNRILSSDSDIRVIGTASNGDEAIAFVNRTKPDVITMDIVMPKMDGFEATRNIMETNPVPIVIVSGSLVQEEVEKTWRAMEAGAVAVLEKPRFTATISGEAAKLIQTVKLMSQVKPVRRWKRSKLNGRVDPPAVTKNSEPASRSIRVVAIGASTGGPLVLHTILRELPPTFPAPILLVQHITAGFTAGFVDWLDRSCSLTVRLASHGEMALAGCVYVAPDGRHMKIDAEGRILITAENTKKGIVPSVASLFRSVALAFGDKAVGVLLTGMGKDGAEDLYLMRQQGAVTIAQDEESSVVYGMPFEAVKLGAAMHCLPPDQIAKMLKDLVI